MDWINAIDEQPLEKIVPVRGNISRAYRQVCYGAGSRSKDGKAARRKARRALRHALNGGRVRFTPFTSYDVW